MKKRIVSILLAVCLCAALLPTAALATTNGRTQAEAVAWARSMADSHTYCGECVELIKKYYAWFGVKTPSGNAKTYANSNNVPSGWWVDNTPSLGAVYVEADYNPGHVSIVVDIDANGTLTTVDSNVIGSQFGQYDAQYYSWPKLRARSTYAGVANKYFVHPDFSQPVPAAPAAPAVPTNQNVTPGKYTLTHVSSGKMMNYDAGYRDKRLDLWPADGSPEQTFDIQYKGSGQYALLIQHTDGGCVNVERVEGQTAALGDKITRYPSYTGETHHRFYFTKLSDGSYIIRPYSNPSLAVGATSSATETGLTLQQYSESDTSVRWRLNALDLPVSTPEPTPEPAPSPTPEPTPAPTPSQMPEPSPEPSPAPSAGGNLESEPNDTIVTANAIALDREVQGELSKSGDVDWYTFTLPQPGVVQLSFDHEYVDSSANYWKTSFFTMDNQTIATESWHGNATVTENGAELGLPAGSYCLKIERVNYSAVPYRFVVNYTAAQDWEKEPNNTPVTSTQITTDSTYHGSIIGSADADWYRFTLPKASAVYLLFDHGYLDSAANYWRTTLYALENVNKILYQVGWSGNATKTEQSKEIELPAGSYYLKIERVNYSDKSYSFSVNTATSQSLSGSDVHFPRVNTYFQDQFKDVPANQWYTGNVADAFELGLMVGNSEATFNPYGDVTIAEAVTMASRIHSIYMNGGEDFKQSGSKWYQVYMDYAYQNGIISVAYYNCDATQKATRAQFAEIFANALPDEALASVNTVKDNVIPDVKISDRYGSYVYKLYRAGILSGSDSNGTFNPQTYITRAESAAVVSRMAESENRVMITLG